MNLKKINRALISVADKSNLLKIAMILKKHCVEILASDGTAKFLQESNISSIKISDYTGFPEILGGRVKTLNPLIFAGILAKQNNTEHLNDLTTVNAKPIDLVIVDLYHFHENQSVEKIDIGGSALMRAAAKNFNDVAIVVNDRHLNELIYELENDCQTSLQLRMKLALEAFNYSTYYDNEIAGWLTKQVNPNYSFENVDTVLGSNFLPMRYGENPNQKAIFQTFYNQNKFGFKQFGGKELSFNNLLDAHAAIHLCYEFEEPCIVIVKHNNPCCVACGKNSFDAYKKAIASDRESSFGGIVACNEKIDEQTAEKIIEIFTELVIAPKISIKAMTIFKTKPNLRVLTFENIKEISNKFDLKLAMGGMLIQETDYSINTDNWKCVTQKKPTQKEYEDAAFAYKVAKHVKSNAIVFTSNKTAIAIGPGQTSRVQSARIALERLNNLKNCKDVNMIPTKDDPDDYSDDLSVAIQNLVSYYPTFDKLVMASDGFLPFADSLEIAIESGIKLVIQPGGSIKDKEVIAKADDEGIAMIFTGQRVFKH